MAVILVVDDDEQLRLVMRLALEADGHEVVDAKDGRQGIELLHLRDPDLMITDILMPTQEGIETIREAKALQPDLPIVAVSGGGRFGQAEMLHLAREFGADAALAKPFRPASLCETVAGLLDKPAED